MARKTGKARWIFAAAIPTIYAGSHARPARPADLFYAAAVRHLPEDQTP
ncbi:MAG: hypothetical protein ACT7A5_30450 [Ferrovibrionaceae bacterium]